MDALTWSRFHSLVIVALGITWVLDGLEVTLAGAVSAALVDGPQTPDLLRRGVGATSREFTHSVVAGFQLFQPWGSAA